MSSELWHLLESLSEAEHQESYQEAHLEINFPPGTAVIVSLGVGTLCFHFHLATKNCFYFLLYLINDPLVIQ